MQEQVTQPLSGRKHGRSEKAAIPVLSIKKQVSMVNTLLELVGGDMLNC